MLTLRTIMSQIRAGDWFVTVDLKDAYFHIQVVRRHRKGLPVQGSSLWPGFGTEDVHEVHGCCSGSFEAPGHSCTQLPGRLAHSGPLQGVSEPPQGCPPPPHSSSWPQNEHQEEYSYPFSTHCALGSSL